MDNIRDNAPTVTAVRQRILRSSTFIALSQVSGLFSEDEKKEVANFLFESVARELLRRHPDIKLTRLTLDSCRQVTTVIEWARVQAQNKYPNLNSLIKIRIGAKNPMCTVEVSISWALTATIINDMGAIRSYVDFIRHDEATK